METVTTTLLWLCLQGVCIEVTPHAMAVAACESGDTVTLGTGRWDAVGINADAEQSTDGGAWQFNDHWIWNHDNDWTIAPFARSLGMDSATFYALWPHPSDAPPEIQYQLFEYLWADGAGAWYWSASEPCWSKWVTP